MLSMGGTGCRLDLCRPILMFWELEKCVSKNSVPRVAALTLTAVRARAAVVASTWLTTTDHVGSLLESCSQLLYALRVLRDHGLPSSAMNEVLRSPLLAEILYCVPTWARFGSAADRKRLDAFPRRCKRLRYCDDKLPAINNLLDMMLAINNLRMLN